jgi:hypothetical protein
MQFLTARRWLQFIAVLHILGGLMLPFVVQTRILDLYNTFNASLFQALRPDLAAPRQSAFALGLFGPTIASWGVLFLFCVTALFDLRRPGAWWALMLAVLAWAPYDALLSWQAGFYVNVVLDAGVVLSLLIPLLHVRSRFQTIRAAG